MIILVYRSMVAVYRRRWRAIASLPPD